MGRQIVFGIIAILIAVFVVIVIVRCGGNSNRKPQGTASVQVTNRTELVEAERIIKAKISNASSVAEVAQALRAIGFETDGTIGRDGTLMASTPRKVSKFNFVDRRLLVTIVIGGDGVPGEIKVRESFTGP